MGVTMKFIKTHEETNGAGWDVEYIIEPRKGKDILPHTHLHSDEWFHVLKGHGRYWINGKEKACTEGDKLYFPAGMPHIHPWNTSNETLIMRNTIAIKDPLKADIGEVKRMEDYYEHWFHLACRGRVRKNGTPYLLQSAVFLRALRKHIVLAKIPMIVQNMLITPLAITGKLMGYKKTYYE
jgi:mannose-6-phosphate isomerase-like protein (cupin superfamily)